MPRCKCGQDIQFVVTKSFAKMPVEAAPKHVMIRNGDHWELKTDARLVHWDCPRARDFKKERQSDG